MKTLNPYLGHVDFCQCDLSRRRFLGFTAGAVAGVATSSLSLPALASEHDCDHEDERVAAPRPIPGGVTVGPPAISPPAVLIHHFPFVAAIIPFREPSQITDFKGLVTSCRVTGRGTGTDAAGTRTRLAYQVDNGVMDGKFVGLDGRRHKGTFGFT
jgi:hypothetical protein